MSSEIREKPLISIIVPVYNILEYLPRCVQSLQAQTYEKIEIILVDDGSTDGTDKLCDQLAEGDARIKVFHKENGGSSSARNLGITKASGEYIGFVDSDDYVDSTMYEMLYNGIEQYQVSVAQIGRNEIDMNGNALPDICTPPTEAQCIGAKDFLRELLLHRGDCSFCTKLVKKELLEKEQFPLGVLNEDFHLLVKLLDTIGQIVSLPGQAYHVFCRMGSNTRRENNFSRVYTDNVDNADMVLKMVREAYPDMLPIAIRFGIFQRLDYMLHVPIDQMDKSNVQYKEIVQWLRKNWLNGMKSAYLTKKNKIYHTLFVIAPKGIRKLHRWMKHSNK